MKTNFTNRESKKKYAESIVQLFESAPILPKKLEKMFYSALKYQAYDDIIDLWENFIGEIN